MSCRCVGLSHTCESMFLCKRDCSLTTLYGLSHVSCAGRPILSWRKSVAVGKLCGRVLLYRWILQCDSEYVSRRYVRIARVRLIYSWLCSFGAVSVVCCIFGDCSDLAESEFCLTRVFIEPSTLPQVRIVPPERQDRQAVREVPTVLVPVQVGRQLVQQVRGKIYDGNAIDVRGARGEVQCVLCGLPRRRDRKRGKSACCVCGLIMQARALTIVHSDFLFHFISVIGNYCTGGAAIATCPVGSQCPSGSSGPSSCPAGYYQSSSGQSGCNGCPTGMTHIHITVAEQGCSELYSGRAEAIFRLPSIWLNHLL